ncbi:hypothetical protein Bpfe_017683, partial [Biomphalaria pfeifferi]
MGNQLIFDLKDNVEKKWKTIVHKMKYQIEIESQEISKETVSIMWRARNDEEWNGWQYKMSDELSRMTISCKDPI